MGLLLFGGALFIGQRTELSETFQLDFQGERTSGRAERLSNKFYRLTYTHTSGDIYSRTYSGSRGIPKSDGETVSLLIAYDPQRPNEFQPAGISYLPMAAVVALSAAGATLVFFANHRLVRGHKAR